MLRTTLSGIWARKRRVAGTSLAVILGVAFLCATLVMGDTMQASFKGLFGQANAGTDVVVRNATTIGTDDDEQRGTLDASLAAQLAEVPGITVVEPHIAGTAQIVGADGKPLGGQGPPTMAQSWVVDATLNPFEVSKGRAPQAAGEVVIDAKAATDGGLEVGDTTTIRTPDPVPVTIVGIVSFGGSPSMNGATFVAFTPEQATELLGQPGQVDEFLIRGEGDEAALSAAVAEVLPAEAESLTAAEVTAEQQKAIEGDFLGFVRTFLLAFAGVALVVATFSINNTFTILMAQRSRETALLRAIGASRRQVLASVAIEAVIVGVLASAAGLVAGYAIAMGLKAVLAGVGLELGDIDLVVTTGSMAIAFGIGVVVTLVASAMPAIRASRVAPMEALRSSAAESTDVSRSRTILGTVVAVVGTALLVYSSSADSALTLAGIAAVLILFGTIALGPILARPAARLIGAPIARFRGQPGRLARLNAMRNPRRTSASAVALVIGTAVVALFATFGASIQASIDQTVDRSFGGDLVLTQDSFSGAGISPKVAPAVAELPEVADSVALSNAVVTVEGEDQYPTVADPARLDAIVDLGVNEGSLQVLQPGQLAVSEAFATDNELELGSTVPFTFVDGTDLALEVGAIYDVDDLMGDLIMTPTDWAPHAAKAGDVAVLIELANGVSLDQGRTAVQAVSDTFAGPEVMDRQEYVDSVAGEIDQLLILVYGLLGLAVIIALLGIANTLSLSIHERTRELGLLRAIGLTKAKLRSTVRWESVITALLGTVVGLGVGTFLGWGLVRALAAEEGFITFRTPTQTLVIVLVLAAASGVLAAVRPAQRAARLDVLDAIATR